MSDGPGRGDTDDTVPVGGGFDVAHLQAVHRRLFDGVDPDAGRLRTVDPPAALTAAGDTGDPDPLRAILQGAVHRIDPTIGTGVGCR